MTKALEMLLSKAQLLLIGARGELAKALQIILNFISNKQRSRYPLLQPDGIFGPKTKARVQEFQSQNRLTPDGIVGPKTKQALSRNV